MDELFRSLATAAPREAAGVLLTGMGTDGAAGLLMLRRAGGLCMAQDEASSEVFGMPRAAIERGAAEIVLPPRALGLELARRLEGQVERASEPACTPRQPAAEAMPKRR